MVRQHRRLEQISGQDREEWYQSRYGTRFGALALAVIAMTSIASYREALPKDKGEAATLLESDKVVTEQQRLARPEQSLERSTNSPNHPVEFDGERAEELGEYLNSHPEAISYIVGQALTEFDNQGAAYGSNAEEIQRMVPTIESIQTRSNSEMLSGEACSPHPVVIATKDSRTNTGRISLEISRQDCINTGAADTNASLVSLELARNGGPGSGADEPLLQSLREIAAGSGDSFRVTGVKTVGVDGDSMSVHFNNNIFRMNEQGRRPESLSEARQGIDTTLQRAADMSRNL